MAEYIEKKEFIRQITCNMAEFIGSPDDVQKHDEQCNYAICMIEDAPAADVAPVVRCKDCEYSYDEISYLCCSHGVCVDCEVPPNFSCAYGKRRAENEPPEEGDE